VKEALQWLLHTNNNNPNNCLMTSNILYCSIISVKHFPVKLRTFCIFQEIYPFLHCYFVEDRADKLLYIL